MSLELIDKQDMAEIVRDQIANLLVVETLNQVQLATTAGKPDPDLWNLRVFVNRANIWEIFPNFTESKVPVINIYRDTETFEPRASNVIERQRCSATYRIDCYGYGESADEPDGGHIPGDAAAIEAVERAVRLVRNILMAGENTYLKLRGYVGTRWIDNITHFQPEQDSQNSHHVVGSRISFRVEFNELSPQVPAETLELLSVQVKRTEGNQVVIAADFDYT